MARACTCVPNCPVLDKLVISKAIGPFDVRLAGPEVFHVVNSIIKQIDKLISLNKLRQERVFCFSKTLAVHPSLSLCSILTKNISSNAVPILSHIDFVVNIRRAKLTDYRTLQPVLLIVAASVFAVVEIAFDSTLYIKGV